MNTERKAKAEASEARNGHEKTHMQEDRAAGKKDDWTLPERRWASQSGGFIRKYGSSRRDLISAPCRSFPPASPFFPEMTAHRASCSQTLAPMPIARAAGPSMTVWRTRISRLVFKSWRNCSRTSDPLAAAVGSRCISFWRCFWSVLRCRTAEFTDLFFFSFQRLSVTPQFANRLALINVTHTYHDVFAGVPRLNGQPAPMHLD